MENGISFNAIYVINKFAQKNAILGEPVINAYSTRGPPPSNEDKHQALPRILSQVSALIKPQQNIRG